MKKEVWDVLMPFSCNQKTSYLQNYNGRNFVVANIDGIPTPFYMSSNGTSGKNRGEWYPFYGLAKGWWVKDGWKKDTNDWEYNRFASPDRQKKIQEMSMFLNKNMKSETGRFDILQQENNDFPFQQLPDDFSEQNINTSFNIPCSIDMKSVESNDEEYEKLLRYFS